MYKEKKEEIRNDFFMVHIETETFCARVPMGAHFITSNVQKICLGFNGRETIRILPLLIAIQCGNEARICTTGLVISFHTH